MNARSLSAPTVSALTVTVKGLSAAVLQADLSQRRKASGRDG
jgi:hypothetical protein